MPGIGRPRLHAGCALLAATAAALGGCASSAAGGSHGPSFDGKRWRVVEVHGPGHDDPVPAKADAWLRFDGHGQLTVADTTDRYRLRYATTDDGFRPHGSIASAGWVMTKQQIRIAEGISDVATGTTPRGGTSTIVQVRTGSHGRMIFAANGYALICVRAHPTVPPPASRPPSEGPSSPGS